MAISESDVAQGYINSTYAESFVDYGELYKLEKSAGWILQRLIPDTDDHDGMGCYPFFACMDWSQIGRDLSYVSDDLVSMVLVTDPFGAYSEALLQQSFIDLVKPFKEHFVIDLSSSSNSIVCENHLRNVRKAQQSVQVEICADASMYLEEWTDLYGNLIQRHNIQGMRAFSKASFAKQLKVPGIVALRAAYDERTVGMLLWYVQDQIAYYHLGAYSTMGYNLHASFALFWFAIEYFASIGLKWLSLGAGAGISNDATDGLTRFKRGWATGTRITYLCGRILNRKKYDEIVKKKGISSTEYFPAYRLGEF